MNLPTNKELDNIKLPEIDHPSAWYHLESGKEHYRLLSWLAKGKKLVFDVGTYSGFSACAMSTAKQVITYDITNLRETFIMPKNIEFCVGDVLKDKRLIDAELISLDTAHNGDFEVEFYNHLVLRDWSGILVCDDIHLNDEMKNFWNQVDKPKIDATHLGHYTGTGIIIF